MTSWWSWLSRGLLELLSPGCCHLCGRHIPQFEQVFCPSCRQELLAEPFPTCPHCAASLGPYALTAGGCVHCSKENFPFEQALRIGPYLSEGPLHDVVIRMKRPAGEFLGRLIIRLWLERDLARFQGLGVDAVVAVPSHWLRRLQRGCEPSATLARELARRLQLPCAQSWLYRVRNTPKQVGLNGEQRRTNVHNAFAVKKGLSLKGRSLLLVDDVMTTGATLREASRPLLHAGAARVVVAVLGRRSPSSGS